MLNEENCKSHISTTFQTTFWKGMSIQAAFCDTLEICVASYISHDHPNIHEELITWSCF